MLASISIQEWEGVKEVLGIMVRRIETLETLVSQNVGISARQQDQLGTISDQVSQIPELMQRQLAQHDALANQTVSAIETSKRLANEVQAIVIRVSRIEEALSGR